MKNTILLASLLTVSTVLKAQQTVNQTINVMSNGINSTELLLYKQDNTNYHSLYSNSTGIGLFNSTSNKTNFFINYADNIGIGTTTPNEKLSVNGKIRAKEIKVETANWPDYVFAEGYQVGTLEALESYIKANKRLPEMPSAKEVETNGLQLGEMLKLQQKKIEELTLLLIEQNKQLQNLREKNKELLEEKNKNLQQEERIAKLEALIKRKK
ncbi:hypothetical protein VRU48_12285 [Pedobacter sp. KR3-3]|uniref:Uncharacterized protein n=1 Tax=Pedobacter albus TaxID=3113905 RepID=A0ABU7I8T5_9SPHI|nr:hypothetical protein [Pedobacter sp. KR3-3]MEE1945890.1 hypothetical protein [Pedobacter sp. KR3-3]